MRSSAFTVLKLHLPSIQTVTSPYYIVIQHRCFIIGVSVNMSLTLLYLLSLIHKYLAVIRFRCLHSTLRHNRTTLRTNKWVQLIWQWSHLNYYTTLNCQLHALPTLSLGKRTSGSRTRGRVVPESTCGGEERIALITWRTQMRTVQPAASHNT